MLSYPRPSREQASDIQVGTPKYGRMKRIIKNQAAIKIRAPQGKSLDMRHHQLSEKIFKLEKISI
ncbi:MAG: hypothetical protein CVV64_08370 [Candidatus Wallbacteria bacterium HGW-Wallbacteria-1]|uniref:Uncharacterized protein n=1 Tax=Candidatus Wallbacteria bacterium HGW-Wallbacteria-1 TaxID=2013854 RepID=A0A2N1PRB9_9BACT|nr:MAG: hypothetical protein CVV64_08370 [Candidatus Wallbacteria bacterium HGW-Wallbacteria-1]